ncbi:MAG TPA: DUF4167 domain-containing protein [Sphingomicrobium sp.]|nr:DUF4167 domain-containing protein [Sphingomicrobium sp.]
MRPNQQNNKNRQRGRNNNGGRKHINPLSRNFESNGPDVKVRGNAAHIAEKYLQLARDAQSSGDSVMAENYLQHAEHYNRIVMASQPQNRFDQFGQQIPADQQQSEDDDFPPVYDRFASPEPRQYQQPPQDNQNQQQPQGQPSESLSGDTVVVQAVAVEGDAAEGGQQAAGQSAPQGEEGEGHRRRDRQRRRRRNFENNGQGGDPGSSPQPDVGELPAFLTAGTSNAAE